MSSTKAAGAPKGHSNMLAFWAVAIPFSLIATCNAENSNSTNAAVQSRENTINHLMQDIREGHITPTHLNTLDSFNISNAQQHAIPEEP
jgi:hypothetical protein